MIIKEITDFYYKYGFYTPIEVDKFTKGLNENTIRILSEKKNEPQWMMYWRLDAFRLWQKLMEPKWGNIIFKTKKYQDISYYSAPKIKNKSNNLENLEKVDPSLLTTFTKLGLSFKDQKTLSGIAIDVVMDSILVAKTFKQTLNEKGIIFCSISEAINKHPELVKKFLGKVISKNDNFYAALNSAVFSDGSFCYIPMGVSCPIELSTYFRINEGGIGQFERTLLIADKGSNVSYLEGCTAPQRKENQLHAAVVELIALEGAQIKYSTVQNWFSGDENGNGGIYNFVTKRGICESKAKISWTQIETGSSITWKYPSCILSGNDSIGEFYSVALTKNYQQADTGTKMIHIGDNTKSTIISKGISAGKSKNNYRGMVKVSSKTENARNFSKCDSLLIGDECGAFTFPFIEVKNSSAKIEHEATISKIEDEQIFYCSQRGIDFEKSVSLIINGFSREVLNKLPLEFATEARKLLEISLDGSVG